jgi:hypothetical protein
MLNKAISQQTELLTRKFSLVESRLPEKLVLPVAFAKTIRTFFPELGKNIAAIKDPRMLNKTDYDLNLLGWVGIFMFFLSLVQ